MRRVNDYMSQGMAEQIVERLDEFEDDMVGAAELVLELCLAVEEGRLADWWDSL